MSSQRRRLAAVTAAAALALGFAGCGGGDGGGGMAPREQPAGADRSHQGRHLDYLPSGHRAPRPPAHVRRSRHHQPRPDWCTAPW